MTPGTDKPAPATDKPATALKAVGVLVVSAIVSAATVWTYVELSAYFGLPLLPPTRSGLVVFGATSLFLAILAHPSVAKAAWQGMARLVAGALLIILILAVGAAVGLHFYTRSEDSRRPYVAVVASKKSIDFPIPREFLEGLDKAAARDGILSTRDGRRVDLTEYEDLGNPDEAARIAQTLAADPNCVLVIGNSNSTLTAITLDTFLRAKNPPSYILPIASANDIMTKAKSGRHEAVLRMIPDNAAQAQAIAAIVLRESPHRRVAIYVDEENTFYSQGLSRDVASQIRSGGGQVVIEQSLGPNNSFYQSLPAWKLPSPMAPEMIVYVGVAHHGLLLVDQVAATGISAPVVFSDGCMVGDLLKYVHRIPRNRAFVLSPVAKSRDGGEMPTYAPIGEDAHRLAKDIIERANSTTRQGVREWLARNKGGLKFNGVAGEYAFNSDGENPAMTWKVYEVTNGRLVAYRP